MLLDLAGHTVGSMGLWLNLDSGPVLLTGDAAWVVDNYRDLSLPITWHIFDVRRYWRRLIAIRRTQESAPELLIFPGHDLGPVRGARREGIALAPWPRP